MCSDIHGENKLFHLISLNFPLLQRAKDIVQNVFNGIWTVLQFVARVESTCLVCFVYKSRVHDELLSLYMYIDFGYCLS